MPQLPPCLVTSLRPLQQGSHGDVLYSGVTAERISFPSKVEEYKPFPTFAAIALKLAQCFASMTTWWARDRCTEATGVPFEKSWPVHRGAGIAQAASPDTATCRNPEHRCTPSSRYH